MLWRSLHLHLVSVLCQIHLKVVGVEVEVVGSIQTGIDSALLVPESRCHMAVAVAGGYSHLEQEEAVVLSCLEVAVFAAGIRHSDMSLVMLASTYLGMAG